MTGEYSYDEHSEVLARYFLADLKGVTEEQIQKCAQEIQTAVEDFIASEGLEE